MARRRNARVDRDVRAAVADVLASEVHDPRLALVTITEVDVTPDHEVATVYWATPDPALVSDERRARGRAARPVRSDEVAAALESAAPLLRREVGRRVRLRVTPELRFRPDPVLSQVAEIERLLREVRLDPPATPDASSVDVSPPEVSSPDAGDDA
jgi:ribosome-binding factor A